MEDVSFQDLQESEKIDYWNFVNAENAETNMHYDASKNNGVKGGENNFETLKQPEAEKVNDASQSIIRKLTHQLEKCNNEIVQLKANIDRQAVEERNYQKEKNDIINEKNNLLKILYQKNNLIERMTSDIKILEAQLKSTVSEKFDALTRLTAIEGNAQTLSFLDAISGIEDEALSRTLDFSEQKLRNEQDQRRNDITGIDLRSESSIKQSMDDPVTTHSEIMEKSQIDEHITYQSEVPNQKKSPENADLVGLSASNDHNMTVKQNKRAPVDDMDSNVDVVSSQNDIQNMELDFLSEVRTRGQNQFLRNAFRSIEPTGNETTDKQKRMKVHKATHHTPPNKNSKRGRGRKRES